MLRWISRLSRFTTRKNISCSRRGILIILRPSSSCSSVLPPLRISNTQEWRSVFDGARGFACAALGLVLCMASGDSDKRLFKSIKDGDITELKRLIREGIDVNQRHPFGWTPIHIAAINGDDKILKILLEAGADPNAIEEFTTFYKVGRKNGLPSYEVIMERESNFSNRLNKSANFSGFTPLHYAALADNLDCVMLLLNSGADPTLKDDSGHTPTSYTRNQTMINEIKKYTIKFQEEKKRKELEERRKYPLEKRLKEHIVGQQGAILTVAGAIRRKENGWQDKDHPLVFLFLGSSGIGKTELAKQIANYIHKGNKKSFIRLDMSEYQEKHEVAKLIGSPPGYIGHEQGGQLTKQLRECPNAVVLFDEVDKAHPDVLTVMLQLFDEGRLTDGKGKTIECKDAIFVMTSNLASNEIANHALELRQEAQHAAANRKDENEITEQITITRKFKERVVQPILKYHFKRDEFLGRINEMVYFLPFSRSELLELVSRELIRWSKMASDRHGMKITWDREVMNVLADGYNVYYGARSIKHEVERRVVNQLAAAHERQLISHGSSIHITLDYSLEKAVQGQEDEKNESPAIKLQLIKEGSKKVDIKVENVLNQASVNTLLS